MQIARWVLGSPPRPEFPQFPFLLRVPPVPLPDVSSPRESRMRYIMYYAADICNMYMYKCNIIYHIYR